MITREEVIQDALIAYTNKIKEDLYWYHASSAWRQARKEELEVANALLNDLDSGKIIKFVEVEK